MKILKFENAILVSSVSGFGLGLFGSLTHNPLSFTAAISWGIVGFVMGIIIGFYFQKGN